MTNVCPRCQRTHRGLCGIPSSVTIGTAVSSSQRTGQPLKGKPKVARKSVSVLQGLLEMARMHEEKVVELLAVVLPDLPEYDALLDRLGKLGALIAQLNRQIIAREE